jgi:AcrR family transcriptional regulator
MVVSQPTCTPFKSGYSALERRASGFVNSVQVAVYAGQMPRDTLTPERIVKAAIELLDAEGVEGLSMRQLGVKLGSAATAVYWHVKSKDNLIVLAADHVFGEIELPEPTVAGWQDAATAMAGSMYEMIMGHPWLLAAMSTHLIYGPGKARHDNHLLAIYETAGFTGRAADHATQVVVTFVLGTALGAAAEHAWRTRLRRSGGNEAQQLREAVEQVTQIARQFPRLHARSEAWSADEASDDPRQALKFGLQTILDGLQARLAVQP